MFDKIKVTPLAGDASNRSYFRLLLDGTKSLVVMKLAEEPGIKKEEERFTVKRPGNAVSLSAELPFINILRYLEQHSVPVPHLYIHKSNMLFLEDFGANTLEDILSNIITGQADQKTASLYKTAIDHLITMQNIPVSDGCIAFERTFDNNLLLWEFNHYLEYGIGYSSNQKLKNSDRAGLEAAFASLAVEIAGQPYVFTHRDYHSRNLMVEGDRIGVIDFQDALVGPATYDLASLLRDSYTNLPEQVVHELLAYYRDSSNLFADYKTMERFFDITGLHRNLKAIGRFVYIREVKGNDYLCRYIPATLKKVKTVLAKYEDLAPIRKTLSRYVMELL